ncbi:hypothetical protein [uncultured Serinicoccus sp.]|uniref:hypothetical protein n=1 Tax=uncultured Serinicoccus sp. TaxID=735514 RepID=UPI00260EC4E7|nr:hypothetical protein [uncultured Serinicoccus sp.]
MKVTHEGSGATFEAPDGWQVEDTGRPEVLVVLEPEPAEGGVRANLVLTAVDTGGRSLRDWQNGTEALLPRELSDYLVLDLHAVEVDGRPAGSRLAHHVDAEGRALVMEQRFTEVDGLGVTLTATVDTLRYPLVAEELSSCCASLRVPQGTVR